MFSKLQGKMQQTQALNRPAADLWTMSMWVSFLCFAQCDAVMDPATPNVGWLLHSFDAHLRCTVSACVGALCFRHHLRMMGLECDF